MNDKPEDQKDVLEPRGILEQHVRADAQRNTDALLKAALAVFATSGVDAPVREIAEKAGVGVGTFYRHFPQRADLVAAVFRYEIDACADAAPMLAAAHEPGEALAQWMQRYAAFIVTKRGLATVLHSGNPIFDTLPAYFEKRLLPALRALLSAAVAAGEARADVEAKDLLRAVANLCMQTHNAEPAHARRMVALLVDEGQYEGATTPLTGSQALELAELAGIAAEVMGRPVRRQTIADEELRSKLPARGMPDRVADITLGLYVASRQDEFAPADPTLASLLGRTPMTMRDMLVRAISLAG